jgi:hypothetical protein
VVLAVVQLSLHHVSTLAQQHIASPWCLWLLRTWPTHLAFPSRMPGAFCACCCRCTEAARKTLAAADPVGRPMAGPPLQYRPSLLAHHWLKRDWRWGCFASQVLAASVHRCLLLPTGDGIPTVVSTQPSRTDGRRQCCGTSSSNASVWGTTDNLSTASLTYACCQSSHAIVSRSSLEPSHTSLDYPVPQ